MHTVEPRREALSPFSFSSSPSPYNSSSFLSPPLRRRSDLRPALPSPPFPPLASSPLPIFKTLNSKSVSFNTPCSSLLTGAVCFAECEEAAELISLVAAEFEGEWNSPL
ncbi:hypothetical protein Droror1_Dr00007057 [Drosera rotundifolia]